MAKPNGYILFEGPSALDGAPIVVIATGLKAASSNRKTGGMVQTYILRQDVSPVDAVKSGQDASICGDCPHRSPEGFAGRTCYVNVGQGALSVWRAYQRGAYPLVEWSAFEGRVIRFGTYGDPAAAPLAVWTMLQSLAVRTTGYTHQWRNVSPEFAAVCMASADTFEDAQAAQALGYRTFRVTRGDEWGRIETREVLCPASDEAGRKVTCEQCGACGGASTGRKASIFIPIHGANGGAKGQAALEARLIARG